jgi:hypothetical protein
MILERITAWGLTRVYIYNSLPRFSPIKLLATPFIEANRRMTQNKAFHVEMLITCLKDK